MPDNTYSENLTKKKELSLNEIVLDIFRWLRFLLTKWKMIVFVGFVGALLGLTFSLISKVNYAANVVFVLEKSSGSGLGSLASQYGISLGGGGGDGGLFQDDDNIISLIKSRSMVAKTFLTKVEGSGDELLIDYYVRAYNLRETWRNTKLKDIHFSTQKSYLQDSILSELHSIVLKKNLQVAKPDAKGDIIVASFKSLDQQLSKIFIETLIDNVISYYISTQTFKNANNVEILQRQVDSVRTQLNYALSGVAQSTDANVNLNPALQRLKVPSQKRVVDVEMNRSLLIELVKNLELAKITLRQETPLIQIIDKPVLPLKKQKVGKLSGILVGGILGGLLMIIYFTLKKYYTREIKPKLGVS